MKKAYIIPKLELTYMVCVQMIAESLGIHDSHATVSNGGWVKEDNTSSNSSYNVWNDDWSE